MKYLMTYLFFFINLNFAYLQNVKSDINLNLDYQFKLKAKPSYTSEKISTYNNLLILRNGVVIYKDSSLTEYTFDNKLYPIVYKFMNLYEILVEVNERPNKNTTRRFIIQESKIIKIDTLPTFIAEPKDLDNDKDLEYAGFWEYGEIWGENVKVTGYNPIVFYEITEKGIKLDSITTIKRNIEIWNKFYGFKYNGNIEMLVGDKLGKEIKRIEEQ